MTDIVSLTIGSASGPLLIVHGGAGHRSKALATFGNDFEHAALRAALEAGYSVLSSGGSAEESVIAAVCELENAPCFNAGRGAALTSTGTVEMDACVMTGDSKAGAVTGVQNVKNPVLAAQAVKDRTPHVLLGSPSSEQLEQWGIATADPSYFTVAERVQELADAQAGAASEAQHGTVGAVARDRSGHLAAATSTGGIVNQLPGRIGDTPLVGAGNYANDQTVAISCTGTGESFVLEVAAHSVHSLVSLTDASVPVAVDSVLDRVCGRGGMGGAIAIPKTGPGYVAYNSGEMYYGTATEEGLNTHV